MSQGPLSGPESPPPLEPEPLELPLESKPLEPSPALPSGMEAPLEAELPEPPPELELPLDPELPVTLESKSAAAPLEPELPPELEAPAEPEGKPPPELEEELDVSPEPQAQNAATMKIAKGASARVEAFGRTSGCAIALVVTFDGCDVSRKSDRRDDATPLVRHHRKRPASRKSSRSSSRRFGHLQL
jgi:hypothetical protein